MIVTLVKFLHIAAISLWAAGLICFPFLNRQRNDTGTSTDLHRLHSMTRFFYVVLLSPAAFVAIGSGTALIFLRQTFTEWFSIKLLMVGLLAVIHLLTGRVLLRSFDKAATVTPWHYPAMTGVTITVVAAILLVVLAKPHLEWRADGGLFAPGGLREAYESFSGIDHQPDAVIEHQLAAVPSGETGEDRRQHREGQPVRQHFLGRCEPQAPICADDGEQHHRCGGVRPATHAAADALDCQQLRSPDGRGQNAQSEREPGAPDASTQKERIALKPIEDVDAQRGEH